MQELKEKGNFEYQNQNYDKALEYYSEALKIDPENPIIWSNKSATLLKLNKADQAIVAAAEATKRKPTWSKAWNRLISALMFKEDYDTARKTIKRALSIDPQNLMAKQMLNEINNKEFGTSKKKEIEGDGDDTEDEDENIDEVIDTSNLQNKQPVFSNPQIRPHLFQNMNPSLPNPQMQPNLFQNMMQNDKLKQKIKNPNFQRKIFEAQSNPLAAMSDPDIMEAMQEMMKGFKI